MTTPMMQQYREIKAKAPDAILFFRLGDFYEMFGEDAQTAAPILEIALTARDAGNNQRIPMCGVPHHSSNYYLVKLVLAGYKVAICEQVEDPKNTKGIVKREIVRIVSPGTLFEHPEGEPINYYLASIFFDKEWGLAFIDISTGEFNMFQTSSFEILFSELERIRPSELLIPPTILKRSSRLQNLYTTQWDRKNFIDASIIKQKFSQQANLFQKFPIAAMAVSGLWKYLMTSMPGIDPAHICEIKLHSMSQWMAIDPWTRRNLELTETIRGMSKKGTLLQVLDLTKTAFGGRLLRKWIEQPLIIEEKIKQRLDIVQEFVSDQFLRQDLFQNLCLVYDLERLMAKVSYGSANAKDLLSIKQTLQVVPIIRSLITKNEPSQLSPFVNSLHGCDEITKKLEDCLNPDAPASIKDGNLIKDGFSKEIDDLRLIASGGKEWIARLEAEEKEKTGIRSLKVGYNKVFGYYIEVTHANTHLVPSHYERKQTLTNAERYITPELKEYEFKILGAHERICELEYEIFTNLREEIRIESRTILRIAHTLAKIDAFLSLAEVAVRNHYVRPEIRSDGKIIIKEGRHPVVEKMLGDSPFVPNDTVLSPKKHLALITGPNMAGKSTYMRQVALIVLMSHIGSYVPAQTASISIVDQIFTRIGASDDLASGQSTFMVEMKEVAYILQHVSNNSLVILDEIGRGTATFDGLSIAWAVAEYLVSSSEVRPKTLFATHYHELTSLETSFPGIFNLHIGVKESGEDIIFLHKILPGRADQSYGIQVASLAGLPRELLIRARSLLHEFERSNVLDHQIHPLAPSVQLSLFETKEPNPILQEIRDLDFNELSPREALNYLFDLKERILISDKV